MILIGPKKFVSKANLISKVLQPGYCLQVSENKIIFIKNAEVEIFELEKKWAKL